MRVIEANSVVETRVGGSIGTGVIGTGVGIILGE